MRRGKGRGPAPKAKRGRAKGAEADVPEITQAETADMKAAPAVDSSSLPGFTVTVRGSLPKVLAAVVLRKGPIRAHSREAAIARFMSEIGTQIKKADLLDVEECETQETKVPRQPTLPLGEAAKDVDADGNSR